MCGRFVSTSTASQVAQYFGAQVIAEELVARRPNYNVAPTTEVAAVVEDDGVRSVVPLRWGLVPSWAKDLSVGSRMINARVETAATKPAYRRAFARRRCIIPADAFFEWQAGRSGGPKQPFCIARRDRAPLAFGGLWESWHSPDDPAAPAVRTCSVLTTSATGVVKGVHDRMPVLVAPEAWSAWLNEGLVDVDQIQSLVVPVPDDVLVTWPVSTAVNSVRNNEPQLLDEVELIDPSPPTLF